MDKPVYTVGVKRAFLPLYKKYNVTKHEQNTFIVRTEFKDALNVRPRLFLHLEDGSEVCISRIEERDWKVYPNYKEAQKKEEKRLALESARLKKKAAKTATTEEVLQLEATQE